MGTIKQMSGELRDWIIETLRSGVSPVVIADGLVKKGLTRGMHMKVCFKLSETKQFKRRDLEMHNTNTKRPRLVEKAIPFIQMIERLKCFLK